MQNNLSPDFYALSKCKHEIHFKSRIDVGYTSYMFCPPVNIKKARSFYFHQHNLVDHWFTTLCSW